MRSFLFSAVLLLGAAGVSSGQAPAGAQGTAPQAAESATDAAAAVRAQDNIKEAFARQRAAGHPAQADAAAIEAWLRLEMRSNVDNLRFGSRWRPYPADSAFRSRARTTAEALETRVAGLGPVRTWACSYDKKASPIMNGAVAPLIAGANAKSYTKPEVPPYTEAERGFLSGPVPPVMEAEPAPDESSAGWLDLAAARAVRELAEKMRGGLASTELDKSSATVLSPDRAQIREAIRLWRLAAALEKGGTAPKRAPSAKLDAAAGGAADAIVQKYGGAGPKELQDCGFEAYVAKQVGLAAKRLLPRSKAAARGKRKKQ